ncbi:hypothetical protein PACILC2_56240 [Paenibacillus cisolokensis]|jgi:Predicted membrane-bound metal-dependent hydrolases|uniref:Hydrolase n=1 Tax=Paenibacillus cisolokensis TaxID=1658519 RepID=A0ABQ4NFU2_9BACL|nr:metal-dependent hydrolase [Paenibacillus cisolokensis]GIQ67056.1 hypothetical protein PACILC2_56240 [Paenibacillus cisolokensis]
MDSGTHLVMGIGLAGLAAVDPAIAGDQSLHTAVLIGTVAGSQAPDLDGLLRFHSNAAYIRNHRGPTHSLPAIAIWTVLITAALQIAYRGSLPLITVGGWVLLSVVIHIVTDLFNAYGTQAMRPFTEKWISWNIIHIFDPVIFFSHVVAIALWAFGLVEPSLMFPLLYGALILYYVWRTLEHRRISAMLPKLDPLGETLPANRYILIPTVNLAAWNVVRHNADGSFTIGDLRKGRLNWADTARCSDHPAVEKSKSDPAVRSFLYFTSYACAEVKEHDWGYEVRWSDVRYRYRKQYPFVAVLMMDRNYKTLGSYVGWLSDDRLAKRLRMTTY